MSQFRQDPLSGRWVIIAPGRAERPDEFAQPPPAHATSRCPFCAGHESDTPHEIAAYRDDDHPSGDWQVRVVPNKYPAVDLGESKALPATSLYTSQAAYGTHEIIVESPQHATSFSQVNDVQARLTFLAYRDRLQAVAADSRLAYAMVFKNAGPWAGASIQHSHSQLLALPIIPSAVQLELDRAAQHHDDHACCIFCQMLEEELTAKKRLVAETPHFVAFCPYAPRFPYETWILPRRHAARFEEADADQLAELSLLTRALVASIESAVGCTQYNYLIHSAPFRISAADHYHWRLEMFPRITRPAGLEWGTDCFVNPVPPETAADALRNAMPPLSL